MRTFLTSRELLLLALAADVTTWAFRLAADGGPARTGGERVVDHPAGGSNEGWLARTRRGATSTQGRAEVEEIENVASQKSAFLEMKTGAGAGWLDGATIGGDVIGANVGERTTVGGNVVNGNVGTGACVGGNVVNGNVGKNARVMGSVGAQFSTNSNGMKHEVESGAVIMGNVRNAIVKKGARVHGKAICSTVDPEAHVDGGEIEGHCSGFYSPWPRPRKKCPKLLGRGSSPTADPLLGQKKGQRQKAKLLGGEEHRDDIVTVNGKNIQDLPGHLPFGLDALKNARYAGGQLKIGNIVDDSHTVINTSTGNRGRGEDQDLIGGNFYGHGTGRIGAGTDIGGNAYDAVVEAGAHVRGNVYDSRVDPGATVDGDIYENGKKIRVGRRGQRKASDPEEESQRSSPRKKEADGEADGAEEDEEDSAGAEEDHRGGTVTYLNGKELKDAGGTYSSLASAAAADAAVNPGVLKNPEVVLDEEDDGAEADGTRAEAGQRMDANVMDADHKGKAGEMAPAIGPQPVPGVPGEVIKGSDSSSNANASPGHGSTPKKPDEEDSSGEDAVAGGPDSESGAVADLSRPPPVLPPTPPGAAPGEPESLPSAELGAGPPPVLPPAPSPVETPTGPAPLPATEPAPPPTLEPGPTSAEGDAGTRKLALFDDGGGKDEDEVHLRDECFEDEEEVEEGEGESGTFTPPQVVAEAQPQAGASPPNNPAAGGPVVPGAAAPTRTAAAAPSGTPSATPVAAAATSAVINVVSFNMWIPWFKPEHLPLQKKLVEDDLQGVDFFAFQEYYPKGTKLENYLKGTKLYAKVLDASTYGVIEDSWKQKGEDGLAIAYDKTKWELVAGSVRKNITVTPADQDKWCDRKVLVASFDRKEGGARVRVANFHGPLFNGAKDFKTGTTAIKEAMSTKEFGGPGVLQILLGDFNDLYDHIDKPDGPNMVWDDTTFVHAFNSVNHRLIRTKIKNFDHIAVAGTALEGGKSAEFKNEKVREGAYSDHPIIMIGIPVKFPPPKQVDRATTS